MKEYEVLYVDRDTDKSSRMRVFAKDKEEAMSIAERNYRKVYRVVDAWCVSE